MNWSGSIAALLEYQGGSRKGTIDILGMEGAHVNARDLIADILEKNGSIDSVFWIACGGRSSICCPPTP